MGKCKGTILLSLSNEQNDYAQCMKNLEYIQKEEVNTKKSNIKMNIYSYTALSIQTVKKMSVTEGLNETLNDLTNIRLEEYNILFKVVCNDIENDIVNLQFFFLVKKWLNKKMNIEDERVGLYIKASQVDEKKAYALYYKATEFLTYQCTENTPYFIDYWIKSRKGIDITQIKPKSDVILRKFSPLIEIVDSENMGIEYWQQSMGDFFERCREKHIFWEELDSFTVLNADRENARKQKKTELEDKIKNKINKQREACENWDYRLMLILKEYFCTETVKIARKRMSFCNSSQFKECIKEMSLLSFYIFCLFEYNSSVNKDIILDYENDIIILSQITLKMRDIGDGFFQLMLNTIEHSEFGAGYFYFRIHDTSDKKYLKNKYEKYVDAQKDRTDFFLEMQIVDYSTFGVPDKFVRNMEKRATETVDDDDKKRYLELLKDGQQINLSTFFRPNEEETKFWGKYYKISDNIVHHYGLQLFDSVIDSNQGCFLAISTPKYHIENGAKSLYCSFDMQAKPTEECYIPGTQYSALLPLRYIEKTEYTAVNADINYTELVSQSFKGLPMRNVSEKRIRKILEKYEGDSQQIEKTIKEISDNLVDKISDNYIYYSDIAENHLSNRHLEIFCKILIRFISKRPEEANVYIALLRCDDKCMIEITRIFSVFYNKQGKSPIFNNVQIYLSGVNPENAFLFAGSDIATVLNRAERLAIAYGIQPECITILTNMLQRKAVNCSLEDKYGSEFAIAPFELVKYGENEILFNRILNNILKNDISKMKTGCKIPNTHVRLGSKIHIKEFYQAEILFQNNYFTTRFAYLVTEDICKKVCNVDNLVFVGYETYSEMLCYEIVELLKSRQKEKDIQYLIYDQKNGENFRYIEGLRQEKQYSFIFIVPINSTLTTHNKMQAALNRIRKDTDQIIENYGILLFCPQNDDKTFEKIRVHYGWGEIKDSEIETSLVKGGKVKYFFRTNVEWKNALKCKCCFPDVKYDDEQPLIETNKASIIPMQKLELIESDRECGIQSKQDIEEDVDKIKALSKCMIFSHVERNGNHFNFYFQTEQFFRQNKDLISGWLKNINLADNAAKDTIVFNIIVSPQHYSNNGFVVEVNRNVFHNASLVLNIEVNKEFRSNIKAKYSNLLLLYNNLEKCGRRAEICFHYVDDTIISGATFYRAKSIIRSVFPKQLGQIVKVKIFKSVILLLNRTSSFSRMNYQESNFYSYVNLEISSLRTQEDACILCNIVKDAQMMEEMSSTEAMSRYWGERKVYHRCKSIREINLSEISEEQRKRAKRRLICSHRANQVLNAKVHNWGDISEIKNCIITEFLGKGSGKMKAEWQLSYIKILSRPFFSFSSGIRKAIFEIMLQLLDYLLGNNLLKQENPELKKLLNDIDRLKKQKDYRMLYVLLLTLIKRLSDLNSTFIIRKDNIERILKYYKTIEKGDYKKDFRLKYRACIKKLISLSGDEIKATWLEYLLINKEEYSEIERMETKTDISKETMEFYDMLYMENTRVFRDAVWDLTKEKRSKIEEKLKENEAKQEEGQTRLQEDAILVGECYKAVEANYYLQNFKMIYDWNFANDINVLDAVCSLYMYLKYGDYVCTDIQEYYHKLSKILKAATQAEYVQIIVCDEAKEPNLLGDSNNTLDENRVLDELKEMIKDTVDYIDNSYYVPMNNQAGVLKFSREYVENDIPKSNVYFGFVFNSDDWNRRQVIKRLRNVLAFRNEFVHKFEMDFETDAIQQFLISMNQNKLLTGSGTIDHNYAKTRAQFLTDSRHIAEKWEKDEPVLKDMRNQVGYFYYTVANSIISRLFQKAVVGKYDGSVNTSNIIDEWLNTTVLDDIKYLNLYERDEQCKKGGETLKKCSIQIDPTVDLEKYFTYTTGDFTLSAIFILLTVNAGKHTKCGNVYVEVSVSKWEKPCEYKLVFTNLWDRNNDGSQEEIEAIKRQINESNHDALQGITLWTLNKYFRFHTRNMGKEERGVELFLSWKNNEPYFNVAIPVYTKEE